MDEGRQEGLIFGKTKINGPLTGNVEFMAGEIVPAEFLSSVKCIGGCRG